MSKAEATAAAIDVELKALNATLANIEDARPFEDLTVCSLVSCEFRRLFMSTFIGGRRWQSPSRNSGNRQDYGQEGQVDRPGYVFSYPDPFDTDGPSPGYKEKFGDLNVM